MTLALAVAPAHAGSACLLAGVQDRCEFEAASLPAHGYVHEGNMYGANLQYGFFRVYVDANADNRFDAGDTLIVDGAGPRAGTLPLVSGTTYDVELFPGAILVSNPAPASIPVPSALIVW
jgi:hypothetical protein